MNRLHRMIVIALSITMITLITGCSGGGGSSDTSTAVNSESTTNTGKDTSHTTDSATAYDIPPIDEITKQQAEVERLREASDNLPGDATPDQIADASIDYQNAQAGFGGRSAALIMVLGRQVVIGCLPL